ncbi:hypothetical protein AMES_2890 [Amycolatopsis mediterranei S699]|uniref:Uncharacterized protein n=2 Tax=Amycolatopsis mediterranei TaxID=33910 RepID=A0A0H3D234_AMYMU|nr:hypothetical protein [Amycolatopsis mediterranei]ADJ44715.1 hypothetical protein AMED_2921 [Amycolatopsis mediterranei U32]AEK41458.1 hypothetical protein RAM_14850 [Amycolatopsis mediterranei S699]AFO76426.1 hypothetical protein AMES_2890 [Amycolatopsis mediterranei S699]AGT83555.1 hypothetical protein B737_2891 [Amycolatopsis mediterranei RB]KDO07462.1 hypothetical protein DV26_29690 [Amycolatopsis mediterranei]
MNENKFTTNENAETLAENLLATAEGGGLRGYHPVDAAEEPATPPSGPGGVGLPDPPAEAPAEAD